MRFLTTVLACIFASCVVLIFLKLSDNHAEQEYQRLYQQCVADDIKEYQCYSILHVTPQVIYINKGDKK